MNARHLVRRNVECAGHMVVSKEKKVKERILKEQNNSVVG